jgi:hypothetical protein
MTPATYADRQRQADALEASCSEFSPREWRIYRMLRSRDGASSLVDQLCLVRADMRERRGNIRQYIFDLRELRAKQGNVGPALAWQYKISLHLATESLRVSLEGLDRYRHQALSLAEQLASTAARQPERRAAE